MTEKNFVEARIRADLTNTTKTVFAYTWCTAIDFLLLFVSYCWKIKSHLFTFNEHKTIKLHVKFKLLLCPSCVRSNTIGMQTFCVSFFPPCMFVGSPHIALPKKFIPISSVSVNFIQIWLHWINYGCIQLRCLIWIYNTTLHWIR